MIKTVNEVAYATCTRCHHDTQYSRGAILQSGKFVCLLCSHHFVGEINYLCCVYFLPDGTYKASLTQEEHNDLVEIVSKYAASVVDEDEYEQSTYWQKLELMGYTLSGFADSPYIYSGGKYIGQVFYNITKRGTFNKRKPFTVVLSVRIKEEK